MENTVELAVKISKKKLELNAQTNTFRNELNIAKESANLNLKKEQFKTQKQDVITDIELKKMREE